LIALLQRVSEARVVVRGETVAAIDRGLLVLVAVERDDDEASADRLAERLVAYRVFPDEEGKMNRSVRDIAGDILLVPQFTLAADTSKGTRASFTPAADPETGSRLYDRLLRATRERFACVATGLFGADMQVTLTNDGPVTFWLES
jgi:D-tyrosyl-tRNA(Tyr) deacylase